MFKKMLGQWKNGVFIVFSNVCITCKYVCKKCINFLNIKFSMNLKHTLFVDTSILVFGFH